VKKVKPLFFFKAYFFSQSVKSLMSSVQNSSFFMKKISHANNIRASKSVELQSLEHS